MQRTIDDGATFQTATGRKWHITEPRASDVHVYDIAVALGSLCRYAGHAETFLSVAEHSILVADIVWRATRDPLLALMALLHDAAEAYPPGDIMAPAKRTTIMQPLIDLQAAVDRAIAERLGLPQLSEAQREQIDLADKAALLVEWEHLRKTGAPEEASHLQRGVAPYELVGVNARQSRVAFLAIYRALVHATQTRARSPDSMLVPKPSEVDFADPWGVFRGSQLAELDALSDWCVWDDSTGYGSSETVHDESASHAAMRYFEDHVGGLSALLRVCPDGFPYLSNAGRDEGALYWLVTKGFEVSLEVSPIEQEGRNPRRYVVPQGEVKTCE